ncbi:MAG: hypothetical protein RR383_02495, partial [Muribaculaceae bacterium]
WWGLFGGTHGGCVIVVCYLLDGVHVSGCTHSTHVTHPFLHLSGSLRITKIHSERETCRLKK